MRDFLERDQLGYWQAQIKRRNEEVMQARADLHRRKISQQGSDAVSDSEQKEALREAMRRLRVAEEKVALIKKLIPQLHHAIAEYHSHSQPLGDHLTGGFERSLATLEKMVIALESYIATRAPTAPRIDSGTVTSGAATTTGASTTGSAPNRPAARSRPRPPRPPNRPTAGRRPLQQRRRDPRRSRPASPSSRGGPDP